MEKSLRFGSLAPLKHVEFRHFIFNRLFLTMALRMVSTVVAYKLFQLTHSSFSIGLVGLSEFIPVFSLALYAGHVIDQSDKRTLLLKGILSYSICVIGLLVVTMPFFENRLSISFREISFYVIIFFSGIIRAFAGPTSNAIIAQLIPRDALKYAANISSTTYLTASILGHATAGFLIAFIGVHGTFYVVMAYVLLAAYFVYTIEKKPIIQSKANVKAWESVKDGLRFVYRHKVLLGAISLDLFAVLFGGAVALIPEFADRVLNVGPIGFGWLNAAIDIGSVLMIITLTIIPFKQKQGNILLFAVFGFGLCIIAFGFSNIYWMSFAALLIAGMLDGISVLIRGTIFQLTTPDDMRGRVSAVNSMFINSSNELGQFESGFAARMMGTVPSVFFGGCMTILVVLITFWKAPGLRKFEY